MDVSLLRTFVAVYRAGSLSAAAPQLGLSQPTVTAQVKALEGQLGQQLFQRRPRGVTPTSVADELARQVADHIDALNAVADRGISPRHPLARPVHLAGPGELMSTTVVPALVDLVPAGLTLRVTFGLSDDLLAGLGAGRFDLVVSTVRPRVRGISATPFFDEEFVLVAAPSRARRLTGCRTAAALRDVPLVAYAEDLPIIRRYWRTVFGTPPAGAAAIVVPDLRAVLAAVVADAGISVLPRYLCADELAAGEVVPLHDPEVPPINTLYLAARTGTATRPHIHTIQAHLLRALRDR